MPLSDRCYQHVSPTTCSQNPSDRCAWHPFSEDVPANLLSEGSSWHRPLTEYSGIHLHAPPHLSSEPVFLSSLSLKQCLGIFPSVWRRFPGSLSEAAFGHLPLWRRFPGSISDRVFRHSPLHRTEVPSIPLSYVVFPAFRSGSVFSACFSLRVFPACLPLRVFPASLFLSAVISSPRFSKALLSHTESTYFFCYTDGLSKDWRQLCCLPISHVLEA